MVHGPQATAMLYYKASTQLSMAECCSGDWMQLVLVSLPVAPWQDDKSLFKVAACFFIQATLLSLSALILVKYQFESLKLIFFSAYKPPNFVDPRQ